MVHLVQVASLQYEREIGSSGSGSQSETSTSGSSGSSGQSEIPTSGSSGSSGLVWNTNKNVIHPVHVASLKHQQECDSSGSNCQSAIPPRMWFIMFKWPDSNTAKNVFHLVQMARLKHHQENGASGSKMWFIWFKWAAWNIDKKEVHLVKVVRVSCTHKKQLRSAGNIKEKLLIWFTWSVRKCLSLKDNTNFKKLFTTCCWAQPK